MDLLRSPQAVARSCWISTVLSFYAWTLDDGRILAFMSSSWRRVVARAIKSVPSGVSRGARSLHHRACGLRSVPFESYQAARALCCGQRELDRRWLSSTSAGGAPHESEKTADTEPVFENPRTQILEAALARVPEEGWTEAALVAGATSLGFPSLSHGMFLRGPIELVEYYLDKCNTAWMAELDSRQEQLAALSPRERIHVAIELRLRHLAPVLPNWPEALALGLLPHNLESTARHVALLADELCHRAGKDAVDLVWYKDRAVVAGVYVSTELFFLTDYSEDFRDTWAFLERRLDDMENLERSPQSLGDGVHAISAATTAIVSAVSSLAQPAVLQAVQKMPFSGAMSVVLQTLVANVIAMAPPAAHAAAPQQKADEPYPPPPEKDPYEASSNSGLSNTATAPNGGSTTDKPGQAAQSERREWPSAEPRKGL